MGFPIPQVLKMKRSAFLRGGVGVRLGEQVRVAEIDLRLGRISFFRGTAMGNKRDLLEVEINHLMEVAVPVDPRTGDELELKPVSAASVDAAPGRSEGA